MLLDRSAPGYSASRILLEVSICRSNTFPSIGTLAPEILVYTAFFERIAAGDYIVEPNQPSYKEIPQLSNVHRFYAQIGSFCIHR